MDIQLKVGFYRQPQPDSIKLTLIWEMGIIDNREVLSFSFRRGPLVRNWVMRFEAKHNYFKRLSVKMNNFKNITCSLARRHQALQAYLLQAPGGNFLRLSLEVGPGMPINTCTEVINITPPPPPSDIIKLRRKHEIWADLSIF